MAAADASSIIMIGTAMSSPGGMTAVVHSYRDAGLFSRWNVRYLSSYERPGLATQLRVMGGAFLQLLRAQLAGQVSLVHVHSASRGSFWRKSILCALAEAFGVPYIFHVHSGEFPKFYYEECSRPSRWWVRRTLARAACVIALTEHWRRELSDIAPEAHIIALANPVAMPAVPAPDNQVQKKVLFLGRLREKKGITDLVNAIPIVLATLPDAHFILAGDGDIDSVAHQAHRLGITEAITLPGWVDGEIKDALLNSASVLVLPSYFEGLPICVLEAMASGIPVVASNVGGVPEVLDNGRCGWLITPGDVPGLARTLIDALVLTDRRNDIRLAARERVAAHYSREQVAGEIDLLYRALINGKEPRA